jgi:hypothetical protein
MNGMISHKLLAITVLKLPLFEKYVSALSRVLLSTPMLERNKPKLNFCARSCFDSVERPTQSDQHAETRFARKRKHGLRVDINRTLLTPHAIG